MLAFYLPIIIFGAMLEAFSIRNVSPPSVDQMPTTALAPSGTSATGSGRAAASAERALSLSVS
ncbi:hypothetical protein [Bradyrhizobium sp. Gha]|uniref:hypothetical protein n=1 Tax=Bradyrhizobium sp. Gha TaxID=1855318 RepID=UPI0008DFFF20|nr:hypothetical protein [Bradyrhizobium sp. Gha]SFI88654.1 hypothetical protein SAMN05216525_11573 [Bradyrhizobium sp. Gha]